MRNITKALTVASLLAPVSGYSLGIGDIRVRSALNQNLNAEIALVATKGENPSSIKVNLAPSEKFDEAGVPWTYFLSKIRFQTVVKPNGGIVIKVTSREALKEPYLNFLLEVTWPKGSLYREFTVLVDPPADYQQQSYQEPTYAPASPSRYEPYPQQEEYATLPNPVRRAPRSRNVSNVSFGSQVVTRKNDTLWKVASRVRGSGVSVEQMMMSLYENNPHAFYQQNVNALSAGKTLKIPDKNTVKQLSRQEALDEFAKHNEAWKTNRSDVPVSATQEAAEEAVENQLKLEAPTEATVAANENVAPSSEQSPSGKEAASQQQAAVEKESAKTSLPSATDEALQSKIAALEKQMAMMQELIALKDKQLAELQNPAQPPATPESQPKTPVKPEPVQPSPVAPTQPSPTAPLQPAKPKAPTKPVVKSPVRKIIQPAPAPTAEESSPLPWVLGGLGAILLPLFGWLWWQKKKIMQETEAESMFRNYSAMRNNDATGPLSSMTRNATSAVSSESSFLNEFKASDFESFESFNVDHADIDPIEEADVYLAYGRYQQAEDLIRQAIASNPERDECKLKLLEIFHASSNKADFEKFAIELAAAGKQEDKEFWRKATELSKDICPDSPLFAIQIPSTTAVFPAESEVLAESILLGPSVVENPSVSKQPENENADHQGVATFEILNDQVSETSFEANDNGSITHEDTQQHEQPKAEIAESKGNNILSFDLDSLEDSFADTQDSESLDFDLGPYPGSSHKQESGSSSIEYPDTSSLEVDGTKGHPDAPVEKDEIEAFEFDFNFDKKEKETLDLKKAPSEMETIDSWDPEQTLDFSFDTSTEKETVEDNAIDFSFDLEPSLDNSPKTEFQEESFNLSDLTDMDEIETKLDLAKAYIDMGDIDSAKEILSQVLEKGSVEQKKTAMMLLDDLNLG